MYALIQNNQITEIGELQALFPNEANPSHLFATQNGAREIVEGEQLDQRFYWVTFDRYDVQDDKVVRLYVNTPKALEDVAAVKEDNTPVYVQVFDPTVGENGAMVDTTEQVITKGLKSQYLAQFKVTANSMLSATDWTVIRKMERGVDIPADVAAKRAKILTECDRLSAAVTAAQDMPAFILAVQSANWSSDE
jgi:hypothetical protein